MDKETLDELYDEVIVHVPDTHYLTKGELDISCRSVLTNSDGHEDLIFSVAYIGGEYRLICWRQVDYKKQSKYLPAIAEAVRSNIQSWIEEHNG